MLAWDLARAYGAALGQIGDVLFVVSVGVALAAIIPAIFGGLERGLLIGVANDALILLLAGITVVAAIAGGSIEAAASVTASFGAVGLVTVAGACTFALVARRIAPAVGGPWALFLGALGLGVAWLIWIGDESASSTVGVGDFMFSAGVLLIAFGGVTWNTRPSAGRRFERVALILDPGLPVAAVLGSLAITAVAHGPLVMDLVGLSTAAVIVLSVGRQVHLYARAERAREAERVSGRRLADEIEERASTLLSLQRVAPGSTLEETAGKVCEAALGLHGIELAVIRAYRPGGAVVPLAVEGSGAQAAGLVGVALSADRGADVRSRARGGPWAWIAGEAEESPYHRTLRELGVRMTVNAPLRWNDAIIGDIGLGTSSPESAVSLGERLHTIEEFAVVVAALLGPAMAERDRVDVLRRSIESVLADRAFHPVFQPIVELESGTVVGYEALTRFDSGTRPDLCFADAWSAGLGPDLELATLEAAIAASPRLPEGRWLDLNVSPRLLVDAGRLRTILAGVGRPVILEITEHEVINDYAAVHETIHSLGGDIRLAVDDAGAGVANFSHIIELHPDYVKLDISLVRNVNNDFGRQAMVAGIRHFARTAGCSLIAEGIETPEEGLTLTGFGVQYGQGYLLGRPEPVETWATDAPAGADRRFAHPTADPRSLSGAAAASAVADLLGQLEPAHPVADARPHLRRVALGDEQINQCLAVTTPGCEVEVAPVAVDPGRPGRRLGMEREPAHQPDLEPAIVGHRDQPERLGERVAEGSRGRRGVGRQHRGNGLRVRAGRYPFDSGSARLAKGAASIPARSPRFEEPLPEGGRGEPGGSPETAGPNRGASMHQCGGRRCHLADIMRLHGANGPQADNPFLRPPDRPAGAGYRPSWCSDRLSHVSAHARRLRASATEEARPMRTGFGPMQRRGFVLLVAGLLVLSQFPSSLLAATPSNPPPATVLAPAQPPSDPSADPTRAPGAEPLDEGDDPAEEIQKRDDAYITSRTAGDVPFSVQAAGRARAIAMKAAKGLGKTQPPISPVTFNSAWNEISPNPIVQVNRGDNTFYAVSGRVSALAIRPSNGQKILGGAQGGIWTYDETSGTWTARTDDQPTLSIGAIAIAPSNDSIVYAGTGEGNLSGDSYRGDGFLKSTDGGIHWAPIGGDTFDGASIAKIAVDPTNANRLWAAVIRGRAGSRRQTPPTTTTYGIWESDNGGTTWTLRKAAIDELHGATDLVEDPTQPNVLYATFWADGIYESTDAGVSWHRFMTGIPADATFGTGGGTRFALGISHPAGHDRVLYAGFEWTNGAGQDQPSQVWKSVNGGAWTLLPSGDSRQLRQRLGLLRHPVLLRQRDRRRPDGPEYGLRARPLQLRHRFRRRLPVDRWRPDLEGHGLGSPPRLPRDRDQPERHRPGDDRQ